MSDLGRDEKRDSSRSAVEELGELLDEAYPGRGWSGKLAALKSQMLQQFAKLSVDVDGPNSD